MPFLGIIVNVFTIVIGSSVGLAVGNRLSERFRDVLLNTLGIATLFIGFRMAFKSGNELLIMGALILGGITGELLKIEQGLDGLAERLKAMTGSTSPTFVNGFVSATLLFCVGPMTIIGSMQDGMGDSSLLMVKALLDAFASLTLASALGIGVLFSALSVVVIQGGLALAGMMLGQIGSEALIGEIGAVGGLMIVGIGINLLGLKKIPVGSFLPALAFAPLLYWLAQIWGR